jgi:hypothetical protein
MKTNAMPIIAKYKIPIPKGVKNIASVKFFKRINPTIVPKKEPLPYRFTLVRRATSIMYVAIYTVTFKQAISLKSVIVHDITNISE